MDKFSAYQKKKKKQGFNKHILLYDFHKISYSGKTYGGKYLNYDAFYLQMIIFLKMAVTFLIAIGFAFFSKGKLFARKPAFICF